MKKQILLTSFVYSLAISTSAQVNYVLNPSFEQYSECPWTSQQIRLAYYWSGIDSNIGYTGVDSIYTGDAALYPDYFNMCDAVPYGDASVPLSSGFYQYPRTGKGFSIIVPLDDISLSGDASDYRVYLQGRLYKTLTAGVSYCVTFYVNVTNEAGLVSNNIGAYLDDGSIDHVDSVSCLNPQTKYAPQVNETEIINDTLDWVKIQGTFVANGTEKFITLGNFFDFAATSSTTVDYSYPYFTTASGWAEYLVDDISVIESDYTANAGADKIITKGDSAHIGIDSNGEGMPCWWYILGNPNAIDSGGALWVKPDTTTSYVVVQNLCDIITTDTVTVWVGRVGVNNVGISNVRVYPNPANDLLNIENGSSDSYRNPQGSAVKIYNIIGQQVYSATITNSREQLDISRLPAGTYLLQLTDGEGGKVCMNVVKE